MKARGKTGEFYNRTTGAQSRGDYVAKDAQRRKNGILIGAQVNPGRAGELAIDESRRNPRIWRLVVALVMQSLVVAWLDQPISDIGFISQPEHGLFFRGSPRDAMLDSLQEPNDPIRKSGFGVGHSRVHRNPRWVPDDARLTKVK
ncbi:MAG TPA: hypothetical protein VEF36_16240 [Roseiarcus sp.]|nr:hypothetical protein [Roseiarcus sp.]